MNRSDFLVRLLDYYADTKFKYRIIIGDSSNADHAEKTQKALARLKDSLNITYLDCKGINHPNTVRKMSSQVDTPYTALICDDDFLVSASVDKCIDFLEKNRSYSSVHGQGIVFSIKGGWPYGQIENIRAYKQPIIEHEKASRRLIDLLSNYSVILFSIHRTDIWQKMWESAAPIIDKAFSEELLAACLSIIYGKVKKIDCLHLIRQVHERRYLNPDPYDWVTSSNWHSSFVAFKDALIEKLIEKDCVSRQDAERTVKKAFWSYLKTAFVVKYNKGIEREIIYQIKMKDFSSYLKRLKRIVRSIKNSFITFVNPSYISLEALINPFSCYKEDFMPVYRAINSPSSFSEKS
jgi:glycosyltransferase domain-containing protein